jgi:hypothetical protein
MALIDFVETAKLDTVLRFMKGTSFVSLLIFFAGCLLTPTGVTSSAWSVLFPFCTMLALSFASLATYAIARQRGARISSYYAVLPVLLTIVSIILFLGP